MIFLTTSQPKALRLGRYSVNASIAILMLAGCGGSSPPSALPGAMLQTSAIAVSPMGGACFGTEHVKTRPCPVKFTKKDYGAVIVTVSGPGVVNSTIWLNQCSTRSTCTATQMGSIDVTQYQIAPGVRCGDAQVGFDAYNASGSFIGLSYLKVHNEYCPSS